MVDEPVKQLRPAYLRQQADRCQQLSRSCMDLGTAKNLRLMAEDFFVEAAKIEARTSTLEPH